MTFSKLVALVVFGKQSSLRISRRLNMLNIAYRTVLPHETPNFNYTHIILSSASTQLETYDMPEWITTSSVPVLGIGYSMQLIAQHLGCELHKMSAKEVGPVWVTEMSNISQSMHERWMHRNQCVKTVPRSLTVTGVTTSNDIIAFTDNAKWWALQYHPESPKHGDITVFSKFVTHI